jgi:hypothetical protein
MIDGLCTDSRWLGILTWALIPFYAVLFGLIALGLRARGKPVRVFPMLLGVAVVLGALVYFRHKENAYFQDLSVGPGGVELRYFWPKSPLVIPAKDVEAVGLVRGRPRVDQGADGWGHADVVRVEGRRVDGDGDARSREQGGQDAVVAGEVSRREQGGVGDLDRGRGHRRRQDERPGRVRERRAVIQRTIAGERVLR